LQTCQQVGLDVILRIGPWCHGEVRNGGFPDWLQKLGDTNALKLRSDDPTYLGYVQKLYEQIGQQARGLLWKDGGPVIGIQLENEYGGPLQHLLTLKNMAQAAGMDVPLYTHTGNGGGAELLPVSGVYVKVAGVRF
jgi:beta-galactosidase GanA